MNKGKFIVFEGVDFSGKSTQVKMLYDKFISVGHTNTVCTREPGEETVPATASIRELLSNRTKYKIDSTTAVFLMLADRSIHVKEFIKKRIDNGLTVICDRYYLSTLAYQTNDNFDFRKLEEMNSSATENLQPDMIVYINPTSEVIEDRRNKRNRVMEFNDDLPLTTIEKIKTRYEEALYIAKNQNIPICYINDSGESPESIHEQIYKFVLENLEK